MRYRLIHTVLQTLALLLWVFPVSAETDEETYSLFLVAKRDMLDPNFQESVALVRPVPNGAIGVIVNRPTDISLGKLFPDNPVLEASNDNVYVGGPVYPLSLVFIFRSDEQPKQTLRMLGDVYLSFSLGLLEELLTSPQPSRHLRVYAGHSSWGPGQLQYEIKRGSWYVVPADASVIFEMEPKKIWPELIKRATTRSVHAATMETH